MRNLKARYGSWAVITGASDGIGRAMALELKKEGLSLVLCARDGARLERLARELAPQETRVVAADLSTPAGIEALLVATRELDVGMFVPAAGFGTSGAFIEGELSAELSMIDLNCRAVAELSYAFARRFAERRRGALILWSSLVAFQGVPLSANYAATKAYVQTLAEGLRVELAPHGVEVLASAPGPVASGFASRAKMTMARAETPEAVARGTLAALGRRTTTRPGFLSKLLGFSLAMLPRWGRVMVMTQVMRGMAQRSARAISLAG